MRRSGFVFGLVSLAALAAIGACSGSNNQSGFQTGGGSGSGSGGSGSGSGGSGSGSGSGGTLNNDGGVVLTIDDAGDQVLPDGGIIVTTKTTIYANTDTALYSMDPNTQVVTLIGPFTNIDAGADSVTDVAVDAEGDVYVCTESTIYKVALPAGGTGPVALVNATPIVYPSTVTTAPRMYALGFAPPGLLSPPGPDGGPGTVETLVAGDGDGNVWSVDPTTGIAKNLGNFGNDPTVSGNFLGVSGDIVFYSDATTGAATGLAKIRSCAPPPAKYPTDAPTCSKTDDLLAGIDISQLVTAYNSGTPSLSLNGGIYGGSTTTLGPGTGFGELFGLGAWKGDVFGFGNAQAAKDGGAAAVPPDLVSISTTSGTASLVSNSFGFTSGGWSGAGVTTKVTVTVIAPPPPPPPPTPK